MPETPSASAGARWSYPLYLLTLGLTAACGLVVEIVAGRMLAPYLGMSIYTWTAVIAVVLAGFSVGHWVGGRMAMWRAARAERGLGWVLLLAALSTAGSLILIRLAAPPLVAAGLSSVTTIILLTSLLFFLPSFFVGIPSPVLTKLAIEQAPDETGKRIGAMYAIGAFGSIIGTLAAGYIFISWLGSIKTMLLVALVYLLTALVFFLRTCRRRHRLSALPLGLALLLPLGVWLAGDRVLAFRSACEFESQYYCLRIVDISRETGFDSRLMVLDHLGHGMNVNRQPELLLSPYVELQHELVRRHFSDGSHPLSAYFVGGGSYTLPRAWLTSFPQGRMLVSEIDPEVTRLAYERMWLPRTGRLRVLHKDARMALRDLPAGERFDVIVGDAFHDIAVPQHLITSEFFGAVRGRMSARGLYVMNVVDFVKRPRLMLSVMRSLEQHFPVVESWIDLEQARGGGRATFVLLAGNRPTGVPALSSRRFPERNWRRFSARLVAAMSAKLQPFVLTDDYAPVDRLLSDK